MTNKEYQKEYRENNKEKRKLYIENNKEKINETAKLYYENNKENNKEKRKLYIENNKEKIKLYYENNKEKVKLYYENNKEKRKETAKLYYEKVKEKRKIYLENNKEKIAEKQNLYVKNRRLIDPLFKLKCYIRSLIGQSIKNQNYTKRSKIYQILGCSFEEFKTHLENQFTEGMNWENQGKWHLDHIYPVSLAKDEKHLIELNHHTNFQPLWAIDNLKKGNKKPLV